MEANDFIVKLKAEGTEKDLCDLEKVYVEYKHILAKLPTKDRGQFSLNVLCILCRNLEKIPRWRETIDVKALLTISIDCVRETRPLDKPDRVKTLACIYHTHRYVVKQNTSVPPELILKISFMPFECDVDNLLKEYCKTYWSILTDRLTYIEQLKSKRMAIIKLLPKLTEDTLKVIQIYDIVQFCSNILTFLIKKLHFLYNDTNAKELNKVFNDIFQSLTNVKPLKKLNDKEILDLYVKFNDCLYVVAENCSKVSFKDSILNNAVRTFISLLGHSPDIFHCFQTFYLNSFCCILTNEVNASFTETVLNSMMVSCETTEKLGYIKAMYATYPFLNQFLRLYIEYFINNKLWKDFTINIQDGCLKLILFFMKKLKKCNQISKCEGCVLKSGLHDALRLSFHTKHFITNSIEQKFDIKPILPILYTVIKNQQLILNELRQLGCVNHDKYYRKLQTDIHNTAITLNKSEFYDYSIKLFDLYLKEEILHFKSDSDMKNISRALYNKSICELDCKMYEEAINDAFLSLIFAKNDLTEKYMSLVMDIKAKSLKSDEDEKQDEFQMISVLQSMKMCMDNNLYGNLKPFLLTVKFSVLLKHEFSMYSKLWPSIVPIAGVWKSLLGLVNNKHYNWITAENEAVILQTLYEVVLETPSVVRSIHSDHYIQVVNALLDRIRRQTSKTPDDCIVQASLLFMKAEYDYTEASKKYSWKITEPSMDPDQTSAFRTISQEHEAISAAIDALQLLSKVTPHLSKAHPTYLRHSLQISQVFVQQLLYLHKMAEGLQLAHVCCEIAKRINDKASYLRNLSTILHVTKQPTTRTTDMVTVASEWWTDLANCRDNVETALTFICDTAIYYSRGGAYGTAAKLVRIAQSHILAAYDKYPDLNLDLSVGRVLEAQTLSCGGCGPTALSAVSGTQRHYLTIANTATTWSHRRLTTITLKRLISLSSIMSASLSRWLYCWRRARASAAAALPATAALDQAILFANITNTHKMDDAQIKIDNRLKHILGLQPNETQSYSSTINTKQEFFTPKQDAIETMLENQVFKKTQTSPSLPCISVPAFKIPEFLTHDAKCDCYACATPSCIILTCQTIGLEASMYFRAKETDIAKNYYEGVFKMIGLIELKLNALRKKYLNKNFEEYIVDIVGKIYEIDFRNVQLEILIEASFFELFLQNYEKADDYIVRIHELLQESNQIDPYLTNEVMNLMIASAQLRKVIKKPEEFNMEVEFESLKLSPDVEPPKTPTEKPLKPPVPTKLVVKNEEVPSVKRKIIKLNLDEESADEIKEVKVKPKKNLFKIPVPVTSKPALENITPRPTRSRPNIILTQPSDDKIDIPKTTPAKEFFTPVESTPDQFFTPMTSVKTYSKKSLRKDIVKKLENEFSTPQPEKDCLEVPSRSRRRVVDKKDLKRTTSPGKLVKEEKKPTRGRRLRQPVNFSVDEDDDQKTVR